VGRAVIQRRWFPVERVFILPILEQGVVIDDGACCRISTKPEEGPLGACPRIENLLRKSPFGPFFRSFSLNMNDYSPQMIEKLASKWLPLATAPVLGQAPAKGKQYAEV